ncbi:uncharacterized protein B0H18DRAFT_954332 [Fomitopsis serialis]|uniref:uncharacterized protein n=1 Tax=Fomitopsis serialis TaxID=139415 RepID=UPI002007502C|nr:uncharacterized protein B0H18DRAFT_954332 [Neoantrodia serialis]KAH9927633.1 hypothetical protein B0H18DRAFT_954332 [Neoantrodia serialis]
MFSSLPEFKEEWSATVSDDSDGIMDTHEHVHRGPPSGAVRQYPRVCVARDRDDRGAAAAAKGLVALSASAYRSQAAGQSEKAIRCPADAPQPDPPGSTFSRPPPPCLAMLHWHQTAAVAVPCLFGALISSVRLPAPTLEAPCTCAHSNSGAYTKSRTHCLPSARAQRIIYTDPERHLSWSGTQAEGYPDPSSPRSTWQCNDSERCREARGHAFALGDAVRFSRTLNASCPAGQRVCFGPSTTHLAAAHVSELEGLEMRCRPTQFSWGIQYVADISSRPRSSSFRSSTPRDEVTASGAESTSDHPSTVPRYSADAACANCK